MLQVFHMREGPEKLLTPRLIAKVLLYRATHMFRKPSAQAAKVFLLSSLLLSPQSFLALSCRLHPSAAVKTPWNRP